MQLNDSLKEEIIELNKDLLNLQIRYYKNQKQ